MYLEQIMNLVGLYHKSTFGSFPPPRLTYLVMSIGFYYKFIVSAHSLSNCPVILPLILCTMALMLTNKHQEPRVKIISDPNHVIFTIVLIELCLKFLVYFLFPLFSIILYRNIECFTLILVKSS